jgi:pyruvate/2-oxoglutarate dehydrogenase complex dihydrolipoamide dehydrogenase (E3) component
MEIETICIPLGKVDRAITDGETAGFFKIHHQKGSDRIVGATIVATHAGEMISLITLAIEGKWGLGKLSSIIYPYPTQAEGIKKAADSYRRTLLTPRTQKLLKFLAKFS